jgi:hypothetical protein
MVKKKNDKLILNLESIDDITLTDNPCFHLISFYYKLLLKFFKETNNQTTVYMSTNIDSFAAYYLNHFPSFFLKESKFPSVFSSNHNAKLSFTNSFFDKKKNKLQSEELLPTTRTLLNFKCKKLKIDNFLELFYYFNSKLLRWKEIFFDEKKIDSTKCRICEKEVKVKHLGMHSYICAQKENWIESITNINKQLKECLNKLDYISMGINNGNKGEKNEQDCSSPINERILEFEEEFNEKVNLFLIFRIISILIKF